MDISASTIVAIPLDDLRDSPLNARTVESKSIEELAASIKAEGLLQNLTVMEGADGLYEVVAGKSRLKAMRLLHDRGQLPTELLSPPCRIVDEAHAHSASLAENVVREAMHPADEFEAFSRLAKAGKSAEDIAAEFGVLPLVVLRRLRLANVAPSLFALFRQGQIKTDQMMALAITEDHSAQIGAWEGPGGRDAASLRERLTRSEFSILKDGPARFVGADALRAAGVVIRGDLFSDAGDGYTSDRTMVDELALAKLQVVAESLSDEGWSWIEALLDYRSYDAKYGRLHPDHSRQTTTPQDRAATDAITEELNRLNALVDEDEGEGREFTEEESARVDDLEAQLDTIRSRRASQGWTKKQLANAGVIVGLGYEGRVEIHRGLVKGGSKAATAVESAKANASTGKIVGGVASPAISESVIRRLTAQRTAILQGQLLKQPKVALAVLAHALLSTMAFTSRSEASASKIRFASPGQLVDLASELPLCRHFAMMQDDIKALTETLPAPSKLFPWLLEQPVETIHQLLGWCSALSIDTVDRSGVDKSNQAIAGELAAALGVDFADHWEPTRETFLQHVPRVVIEETVQEVRGAAEVAKLVDLNKSQIVDAAEQLLKGKRWLPKVLRTKPAAPKPDAPKVPAVKASKPTQAKKAPLKIAAKTKPAKKKPAAKKSTAKKGARK